MQMSPKETQSKEPQAQEHQLAFLNVVNVTMLHQNKTIGFILLQHVPKHFSGYKVNMSRVRSSPAMYY